MPISQPSLTFMSLVLATASLCGAATITYNVNLTVGAGSASGTIITDGTIGALGRSDILSWNLLLNDGTSTVDLPGQNGAVQGCTGCVANMNYQVAPGDLSATAGQLFFNFVNGSTVNYLAFDIQTFTNSTFPSWRLCMTGSQATCDGPGTESIDVLYSSGVGDISQITTGLSGPQVIGSAAGSGTPEPSTFTLLFAGVAVALVFRMATRRLHKRSFLQ